MHGNAELRLNRLLGDAKTRRDFAVRQPVKTAQRKHFATPGRKRRNCLVQDRAFLVSTDNFGHIGLFLYHGRKLVIPYALETNNLPPSHEIDGGMTRGGKQIGPDAIEFSPGMCPQQPRDGLLHEVVDFGEIRKAPAQIRPQRRSVWFNLISKPPRVIDLRSPVRVWSGRQ